MTGTYDVLESCNKCGCDNYVTPTATMDYGRVCEASTKCKSCGFEDNWFYGHFESSQDTESKCKKY